MAKLGKELARLISFLGLCRVGLVNQLVPHGPSPWVVGGKSGPLPRWGQQEGPPLSQWGSGYLFGLSLVRRMGMEWGVALAPAWHLGIPSFVPGGQGM